MTTDPSTPAEAFATPFDYDFGHKVGDVTLLGHCGERGTSAFADHCFDGPVPTEAVEALFGFDAGFEDLYLKDLTPDGFVERKLEGRQAIVRRDTGTVLNVVSKRFGIHQYRETLLGGAEAILGSSDLQVGGAGLLDHGGVGWVQFNAPDLLRIGGDRIAPTLTVVTSHNSRFATQFRVGLERFICSNMLGTMHTTGQLDRASRRFKIRHTVNSLIRVDEARAALGILVDAQPAMLENVRRLQGTLIKPHQVDMILEAIHPKPKDEEATARTVGNWERRVGHIRSLYERDPRVAPFQGTGWGVVQAFNTYRQWEQPTRNPDGPFGRAMDRYLNGDTEAADARVVEAVYRYAGA